DEAGAEAEAQARLRADVGPFARLGAVAQPVPAERRRALRRVDRAVGVARDGAGAEALLDARVPREIRLLAALVALDGAVAADADDERERERARQVERL